MADKSPAFQFYVKDFLTDDAVLSMTNEQIGAYVLILCHAWLTPEGLLLSALPRIANTPAARFERVVWPSMSAKFDTRADGRVVNRRLEVVRADQLAYRAKKREAGALGGLAKHKHSPSSARNLLQQKPSPSPSPSVRTTPKNGVVARYVERYRERCGGKSPVLTGKDTGQLSQLSKRIGVDEAIAWIDRVFAEPDDFWQKRGYPAASIPELINGLQAKAGKSWSVSRPLDDAPCQRCGHPEKRFHSQTECNERVLSNQTRPVSAETA